MLGLYKLQLCLYHYIISYLEWKDIPMRKHSIQNSKKVALHNTKYKFCARFKYHTMKINTLLELNISHCSGHR